MKSATERDLIRVRGQSLLYALHDFYHGFIAYEALAPEFRPHNPSASGMMTAEAELCVRDDLTITARFTNRFRYDPDATLPKAHFEGPSVASHFTVWVPDPRLGDTTDLGILRHCLIVTPRRLELVETLLRHRGVTIYSAYRSYLADVAPIKVFYVSQGRLKPSPQSTDSKRPGLRAATELLGEAFLLDGSADESTLDEGISSNEASFRGLQTLECARATLNQEARSPATRLTLSQQSP